VSVVVNNYNYGAYVGAAIDSALAQTWPHTEVVVVDDGSTDESAAVIRAYGDRIRAVLQKNGGQAAALNTGMAASTGDLVITLDADDRLHPHFAALVVEVFAEHPDAALAQFRMQVTDSELRTVGTVVPPAYVRLPQGDVSQAVSKWELPSALGPGGAVALPRATVDALFPIPAGQLRYGPDTYVVRGAALLGPVASRDVVVADYRSHGRNDSNVSALDMEYLRTALTRHAEVGRLLVDFAAAHGLREPIDPLRARDPILLSQRLAALRMSPGEHPFPQDARLALMRAGVTAALARRDIGMVGRATHAAWFVLVAVMPRAVALRLASWLLFPLSRPMGRCRRAQRGGANAGH
jgi:hypothetical protein